jgi:hypothetical protein
MLNEMEAFHRLRGIRSTRGRRHRRDDQEFVSVVFPECDRRRRLRAAAWRYLIQLRDSAERLLRRRLEAGSGSTLTMEMVSILIDLGLVEARTAGAALSKEGRRVLLQRREDGSAAD